MFRPLLAGASWRDRLVASLGALIGISVTAAVSVLLVGVPGAPLLIAPIGASTVLLFAIPASPLAQPAPTVGGAVVSTLAGIAATQLVGATALGAGVAVAGAIVAMSLLRCLHAPGGGYALVPVVGGQAILAHGYAFALVPVGLNALLLVAVGWAFHRFVSGHSYPHRAQSGTPSARVVPEDIDAALAELGEPFDVSREDLAALLERAAWHAEARTKSG